MGAGRVLPGGDPPGGAEVVHESGRTRVTRLFLPGSTVIRKEPLGPSGERRVRHEAAMLERLRGVPGVAQLAEAPQYPGSIVVADNVKVPGAPKYREYMRQQQGKLWNTVEHKAHVEYQSLVCDLVLESDYLG